MTLPSLFVVPRDIVNAEVDVVVVPCDRELRGGRRAFDSIAATCGPRLLPLLAERLVARGGSLEPGSVELFDVSGIVVPGRQRAWTWLALVVVHDDTGPNRRRARDPDEALVTQASRALWRALEQIPVDELRVALVPLGGFGVLPPRATRLTLDVLVEHARSTSTRVRQLHWRVREPPDAVAMLDELRATEAAWASVSLARYRKSTDRIVVDVMSHCEVPAGCIGVVFRWRPRDAGVLALLRLVVVAPDGAPERPGMTFFVDGARVEGLPRRLWQPGRHVVAFASSSLARGGALAGVLTDLGRGDLGSTKTIAAFGTWRCAPHPPTSPPVAFDVDDGAWPQLVPVPAPASDEWYFTHHATPALGAPPGLHTTDAPLWVRWTFDVVDGAFS